MSKLGDFIDYELYPRMFEQLPYIFPELDFRRVKGDWHSHYKLDRSKDERTDKTVCTQKVPRRLLEQGGESVDIIDYYANGRGIRDRIEAVKQLASTLGLQLPTFEDREEYLRYREQQERRQTLTEKMSNELLLSPEAAPVRDYLKSRGYSLDIITALARLGVGYCSPISANLMEGAPAGAGTDYTLAIPYRSGGNILGYKLRAISTSTTPKYKNTAGLPKGTSFFGLTGLRFSGNGAKDKDLVLVEGELDALRAQIEGVQNIAAAAGGTLTVEALEEAKKRGVESITLLFDAEGVEAGKTDNSPERIAKSKADTEAKTLKAVRMIADAGLKPYVAFYPDSPDGSKVDADSFITSNGVAAFNEVTATATNGAYYAFLLVQTKYLSTGNLTDKELAGYERETVEILNSNLVTVTERDLIAAHYSESLSGSVTPQALLDRADAAKIEEAKRKQTLEVYRLAKEASALAENGKTEESIELMQRASKMSSITREATFRKLLEVPTEEQYNLEQAEVEAGIETDYYFRKGDRVEQLTLKAGALTFVCGLPSHGKSTVLRTFALQTVQKLIREEKEGVILYLTFEEDKRAIRNELLNTYVGRELTRQTPRSNNLKSIADYYATGSTEYMKREVVQYFQQREADFKKEIITSGRLRIIDVPSFTAEEVVAFIEDAAKQLTVKAVFIDYVQLLHLQSTKLGRPEELLQICSSLRTCAIATRLPLILGAQLNREVKSPTEMYIQNTSESSGIEKEANTVLLIWSSKFEEQKGGTFNASKLDESCSSLSLGYAGQLYVKVGKNRGGMLGEMLLDYEENTGTVRPNKDRVDWEPRGNQSPEETAPKLPF